VGQRHMWFLPVRLLLRDDLDVTETLATLPERILVLHGSDDSIVSDAETRALVEKLPTRPAVVVYPGGHNEPLTHPGIWPVLKDFVETP
jgi:pimeloyl-ACP methyl ester carboxylesterase